MTIMNGWIMPNPKRDPERQEELPALLREIQEASDLDATWPLLQRLIARHTYCDLPNDEARQGLIGGASRFHQAQSLIITWMRRCFSREIPIQHRCSRKCWNRLREPAVRS